MPQRPTTTWTDPASAAPRRVPARTWKVLGVLTGLAVCVAAITYAVLWLTPPTAPRLMVATATYDDTLLVPGNLADGRPFTELTRPGRGRLRPDTAPYTLTGGATDLLAKLSAAREPTVVAVFAADGGCDGGGPFLIPDDGSPDPADRIRVKTILSAVAKLPADTRKLLVFDAAGNTAAPVLGQFHNDFARGVQSLDADIAAVPNLIVLVSAGAEQRSWRSPEWGESAFLHHLKWGLAGDADANGDSRLSANELTEYVGRHTREWARDHRGAAQTPELFPTADGPRRADAMSLGVVDKPNTTDPLPADFTPSRAWVDAWTEFDKLDTSSPHPAGFAPELWREYVGWLMRCDRLLADGGESSADRARQRAEQVRLKILAARPLAVSPQTLALPAALGHSPVNPDALAPLIGKVAQAPAADRPAEWEKAKQQAGGDSTAVRLALGGALVSWVSGDPFARLRLAPDVVSLVVEGFNVVPAELHFLAMLARDLPAHPDTAAVWPLVKKVLELRVRAERIATGPDAEAVRPWIAERVRTADTARRQAEDLLFADADSWAKADGFAETAAAEYGRAWYTAVVVREARHTWHVAAFQLTGLTEWLAAGDHPKDRMDREELLAQVWDTWVTVHELGELLGEPAADRLPRVEAAAESVAATVSLLTAWHRQAVARLLEPRPLGESRAALARWWHDADTALSVPFVESRQELLVGHRRVSRQLHTLADTRREERLTEPSADVVRERAFDAARRRGLLHLAAVGREAIDGYDRIAFRVDQFSRQADAPAELIAAGHEFAAAVRGLPARVRTADPDLVLADRLARRSPLPTAEDPAVRLRKQRAEHLLNWQADRTTADRWNGGDTARPYYRHAADVLRDDARKLTARPPDPARTPESPFPLSTPKTTDIVLTDEPNPQVRFDPKPADPPAVGFVVYRDEATAFVRPTAAPEPIVLPIPARTGDPLTAPTAERSSLVLRGYFRGETADATVNVVRYPVPHTTAVRQPADNAVSVAVRPTPEARAKFGVGSGHLHFVIDCSGSMGGGDDPPTVGQFAAACDKLETVLAAVPRGVTVAVSAFGQKTPGAKTPEDTFAAVRPAGVWKGADDTAAVMKRVRALQPWDKSAVVRAVLSARAQVKETTGARAVILFSDCADNRFSDPDANPKKLTVKDALRAAFGDGCPLHVVAFPAEKAADAVRAEFATVTTFSPPGLFLTPDETTKLADWVRTATAPQVRLEWAGRRTRDALTTGTDAADNWLSPLPKAGQFTLRLPAAELKQEVELFAGERLLVGLSAGKSGPRFTRPSFAASAPAIRREEAGAWTAAVPRQRLTEAGGLELVALADRAGEGAVLTPTRVGDVWFELTSSPKSAVAVKWANTTGWPCPAWDVTCPAWPTAAGKPAAATLSMWWSEKPFPAAGTWTAPTDKPLSAVGPFAATTDVGEVAVSGVSVETHAGRRCLVARLAHPPNQPVVPRVTGGTPAGAEVRVYRDANRVTALFWWDDTDAAVKALTGLEFVAIERAKQRATAVALPTLPPPTADTPAPTPAPR